MSWHGMVAPSAPTPLSSQGAQVKARSRRACSVRLPTIADNEHMFSDLKLELAVALPLRLVVELICRGP